LNLATWRNGVSTSLEPFLKILSRTLGRREAGGISALVKTQIASVFIKTLFLLISQYLFTLISLFFCYNAMQ
jgi:hypothetical protein